MCKILQFICLSLISVFVLAGCVSVPPDEESRSIPWNQPQNWENNGFRGPTLGF